MTDSSNRKALSRRVVVASYAISMAVFLVPFMICAAISERGPLLLFLIPCDIWVLSGNATFVVRPFLLLFLLLGVSGFVVSARQPDRVRWFIFGHVCLIVYYGTWAILILGMFVWAMFEGIHC